MSKYGTIVVNVYNHVTSEQIKAFAAKHSLTYEQVESLVKERLYRKAYNALRNADPEVKEGRKEKQTLRRELMKEFNQEVK